MSMPWMPSRVQTGFMLATIVAYAEHMKEHSGLFQTRVQHAKSGAAQKKWLRGHINDEGNLVYPVPQDDGSTVDVVFDDRQGVVNNGAPV